MGPGKSLKLKQIIISILPMLIILSRKYLGRSLLKKPFLLLAGKHFQKPFLRFMELITCRVSPDILNLNYQFCILRVSVLPFGIHV